MAQAGLPPTGRPRPALGRIIIWLVVLLVLAAMVATVYIGVNVRSFLQEIQSPLPQQGAVVQRVHEGAHINVLLLGVDDDLLRTDTMVLVSIDPEERRAGVVQIPRDTRARLAGTGTMEKINHAHAYGTHDPQFPGPARAMLTVEELLGVPVHYYVRFDFDGFKALVDMMGGVEVDVPQRMFYEDPYQDLTIDLYPGRQELDGEKALQFVRFRNYVDGDLGRIREQRRFMLALLDKAFRVGTVLKLPSMVATAAEYVETNMEPSRIVQLARVATAFKRDSVEIASLPGVDAYIDEVSYFLPDPDRTRELADRLLRGVDREGNASVRVEVLGTPGGEDALADVADTLADLGFAVSNGAGSPGPVAVTQVKGRDAGKVERVAKLLADLGIQVEVHEERAALVDADVQVVVSPDVRLLRR